MEDHFNKLTPAEAERLSLLLEELGETAKEIGEAIQAIGKIQRHGYESTHPAGGLTNRESLEKELGDVWAAVHMMIHNKDISPVAIGKAMQDKLLKVKQYLHHQAWMQ